VRSRSHQHMATSESLSTASAMERHRCHAIPATRIILACQNNFCRVCLRCYIAEPFAAQLTLHVDVLSHDQRVQIMGMLPMFNGMDLGGVASDKETQAKFRRYETMMDSMTEKELDESDVRKLFDPVKIRRIAYGSGSSLVRPAAPLHCARVPLLQWQQAAGDHNMRMPMCL
jgi:Signal peptide binding domain